MRRNVWTRIGVPLLLVTSVVGIASALAVPGEGAQDKTGETAEEDLSPEEIAKLEAYADKFQRGQRLMGGGKDTEAAKIFRELIAERDDIPPVYHALAIVLRYQGKADEATRTFVKAAQLAPKDAIIQRDTGLDLLNRNFPADATGYLKRSVELYAEDVESVVGYGTALRRTGRLDEAARTFEKAVKVEPNSVDAHVGLALSVVGKDPARTLEITEKLNPNFGDVSLARGLALEQMKRYDEAKPILRKAAEVLSPHPAGIEYLRETSEALVRAGDARGAVLAATRWCQADKQGDAGPGVHAAYTLALAHAGAGDAKSAVEVLNGARGQGENAAVRAHVLMFASVILHDAGHAEDAAKLIGPLADAKNETFEATAARRLLGRIEADVLAKHAEGLRANDVAWIESVVAARAGDAAKAAELRKKARELSTPPGEFPGLLVLDPPAETDTENDAKKTAEPGGK